MFDFYGVIFGMFGIVGIYKYLLEVFFLVLDILYCIFVSCFGVMLWKFRILELGDFGGF